MSKDTSNVVHLRMPDNLMKPIRKMALAVGLPTGTQIRLLVIEALKARKIKI